MRKMPMNTNVNEHDDINNTIIHNHVEPKIGNHFERIQKIAVKHANLAIHLHIHICGVKCVKHNTNRPSWLTRVLSPDKKRDFRQICR